MPIAGVILLRVMVSAAFDGADVDDDGFRGFFRFFEGALEPFYIVSINRAKVDKAHVVEDIHRDQ